MLLFVCLFSLKIQQYHRKVSATTRNPPRVLHAPVFSDEGIVLIAGVAAITAFFRYYFHPVQSRHTHFVYDKITLLHI